MRSNEAAALALVLEERLVVLERQGKPLCQCDAKFAALEVRWKCLFLVNICLLFYIVVGMCCS
jgi:hypothetical protein